MKLYEITGAYLQLQERAEEGEDITEALAQLDDALEQKATSVVRVVQGLEADVQAIRAEEQRLKKRRESIEANVERVREYLKHNMAAQGIRQIKSPQFVISLRDGPPKVRVIDEAQLPREYVREKVTREPNKVAILDAYKSAGEVVPGTEVVQEPCLQIK